MSVRVIEPIVPDSFNGQTVILRSYQNHFCFKVKLTVEKVWNTIKPLGSIILAEISTLRKKERGIQKRRKKNDKGIG